MITATPLIPFMRRVRLVRAWGGVGVGFCVGGFAVLLLAVGDLFGWWDSSWILGAGLMAGCALVGGIIGLLWNLTPEALADSIDRRAELQNRVGTAITVADSSLSPVQQEDAWEHLQSIRPKAVYPYRWRRQHTAGLALGAVGFALFGVSRSHILMSVEDKADRTELAKAAPVIERVAKVPEEQGMDKKQTPGEKKLVAEMRELAEKLRKERLSKDQTMQKANELGKKADELMAQRENQSIQHMETAQQKLEDQAMSDAAKELGMNQQQMQEMDQNMVRQQMKEASKDPGKLSQMQQMNEDRMRQLEKEMADLQKQLKDGKNEKGEPLSDKERKELQQKLKEAQKEYQTLKLSQKALDMLKKLTSMPEFKELQKMMQEMMKNMPQGKGTQQQLTKEQIEEMQKALEELAEKLKDEKAMKEYLEGLKKALEQMQQGNQLGEMQMGLLGALGMIPMNGPSGPGQDNFFRNLHNLPKRDTPADIEAKSNPMSVSGKRQEKGEETYVEIKGPTQVGNRSSTPYVDVLPNYTHKAEAALNRKQIPKKHEQRVKKYFDSLQK